MFLDRDAALAAGIPLPSDAVGVRIYGATVGEPSLPADADELAREMWEETDEPIHLWFGLSYASFFVMPRTVMQSMPATWQRRFVALVEESAATFPGWSANWNVTMRDERGRFLQDPLGDYQRGRRRLAPGKPVRGAAGERP